MSRFERDPLTDIPFQIESLMNVLTGVGANAHTSFLVAGERKVAPDGGKIPSRAINFRIFAPGQEVGQTFYMNGTPHHYIHTHSPTSISVRGIPVRIEEIK